MDAINKSTAKIYIITTKQTRFCKLLLERFGVTNIPEDRIFGYGTGTKISVLKKVMAQPENSDKSIVFVEDRYETLEAVSLSMLGVPLQLYLASWGYNTEKARTTADVHPLINCFDLPDYVQQFQLQPQSTGRKETSF